MAVVVAILLEDRVLQQLDTWFHVAFGVMCVCFETFLEEAHVSGDRWPSNL